MGMRKIDARVTLPGRTAYAVAAPLGASHIACRLSPDPRILNSARHAAPGLSNGCSCSDTSLRALSE